MTTGTLRTQGSELFFVDRTQNSDPTLFKMACPTGVTGVGGGAKDQLEDTCLDTTGDKTFKAGLGNPSAISVPFNFIPSNQSHQSLMALKASGDVIPWRLCLSDGTVAPTMDTDFAIEAPAGRTSVLFDGFVSECTIDVATNEIVRGTLTIQRSGSEVWAWNGPVPA
jgi:hypothetical protein